MFTPGGSQQHIALGTAGKLGFGYAYFASWVVVPNITADINALAVQAKQGLAQLEGQLTDRRQQLHTVLNKARPIALANQQVSRYSARWHSGQRTIRQHDMLG